LKNVTINTRILGKVQFTQFTTSERSIGCRNVKKYLKEKHLVNEKYMKIEKVKKV